MIQLNNLPTITLDNDRYLHNDKPVPRVTEILSAMMHDDYLMDWANTMGRKGRNHKTIANEAADIGGFVHEMIERFLRTGEIIFDEQVPSIYSKRVNHGFYSFLSWWELVSKNNQVEILGMEERLVMEHYGGTYDLLLKINGIVYLVDFKTSNHIGYKYMVQMAAYRHMIKEIKGIDIQGIIILQLSKYEDIFYEYIIHLSNPTQSYYMDMCYNCFISIVYAYYHRVFIEQNFKNLFEI